MKDVVLTERYLQAYVNCLPETEKLEGVQELSKTLASFESQVEYLSFLKNPTITLVEKEKSIDQIDFTKCNKYLKHFLLLLIRKGRSSLIPSLHVAADDLGYELQGLVKVLVHTNTKLTDTQILNIKTFISKKYKKMPVIDVEIDPLLIGGFKILIGHSVFDGSVVNSLTNLKFTIN